MNKLWFSLEDRTEFSYRSNGWSWDYSTYTTTNILNFTLFFANHPIVTAITIWFFFVNNEQKGWNSSKNLRCFSRLLILSFKLELRNFMYLKMTKFLIKTVSFYFVMHSKNISSFHHVISWLSNIDLAFHLQDKCSSFAKNLANADERKYRWESFRPVKIYRIITGIEHMK